MRLYVDVCCLSRPFDDQSQARIRLETEAILTILKQCGQGLHSWCSSSAIEQEVEANPDWEKRRLVQMMLDEADERLLLDQDVQRLGVSYHQQGLGVFDAIHLALAERHGCDILLTVDSGFLGTVARITPRPRTAVRNPVAWILEAT